MVFEGAQSHLDSNRQNLYIYILHTDLELQIRIQNYCETNEIKMKWIYRIKYTIKDTEEIKWC